jgi:peptide/nickel transport system permease protein
VKLDYIARRFVVFLIVIWAAATLNFFLPRLAKHDPIKAKMLEDAGRGGYIHSGLEEMIKEYDKKFGLDKPLWIQYRNYLWDISRLELGYSIANYPETVKDILRDSLPWSIGLLGTATIIAFVIGSLLGALLAWSRSPRLIKYLFPPLLTLSAMPFYLLGLVLMFIFAYENKWFPMFGGYSPGTIIDWHSLSFWGDVLHHSILPALSMILAGLGMWALGMRGMMVTVQGEDYMTILAGLGMWALGMRGMMVTVQGEDYMTMAEAKGLKGTTLFLRYAVRNAILPQTTSFVLTLGNIVGGAVLVEVVFAYPGIGTTLFYAIRQFDYFLIQGIIFTVILAIAVGTFLLDMVYPLLDPRISYRRA